MVQYGGYGCSMDSDLWVGVVTGKEEGAVVQQGKARGGVRGCRGLQQGCHLVHARE